MASTWMYGCEKGLQQDTCSKYQADKESRGHAEGWNGCPSCTHREPANDATATADAGYATECTHPKADHYFSEDGLLEWCSACGELVCDHHERKFGKPHPNL